MANGRGYVDALSFARKHLEDRALLEKVEAGFETVDALYGVCKFCAGMHASRLL